MNESKIKSKTDTSNMAGKEDINRVIKFRAWDKAKKKMIPHIEGIMFEGILPAITLTGRDYIHNSQDWDMLYSGEYELMQFTGLTDKKGNQIFEGDVVRVRGRKRKGDYITSVIYHKQGFTLKKNDTYLNDDSCLIAATVIGNIFEDSELLLEQK